MDAILDGDQVGPIEGKLIFGEVSFSIYRLVDCAGILSVTRFLIVRNFDVAIFIPSTYCNMYSNAVQYPYILKVALLIISQPTGIDNLFPDLEASRDGGFDVYSRAFIPS
jgi:hypothetical protein